MSLLGNVQVSLENQKLNTMMSPGQSSNFNIKKSYLHIIRQKKSVIVRGDLYIKKLKTKKKKKMTLGH